MRVVEAGTGNRPPVMPHARDSAMPSAVAPDLRMVIIGLTILRLIGNVIYFCRIPFGRGSSSMSKTEEEEARRGVGELRPDCGDLAMGELLGDDADVMLLPPPPLDTAVFGVTADVSAANNAAGPWATSIAI